MKKSLILAIIVLVAFASDAIAATPSYKSVNSINEYAQVKNTGASALGKGAPVVLEDSEVVTNGVLGVQGTTAVESATLEVGVIGVCTDTIEVGAVGMVLTHGIGSVLVHSAVTTEESIGTCSTSGEADGGCKNIGVALETASARGLVTAFIKCK